MELKNRLKTICMHLGLSIREFERECGLSRGNISNMTGALGTDKVSKIIARYPMINLYWLITGEGEIFRENERNNMQFHEDEIIEFRDLLSVQENVLNEQKKILDIFRKQVDLKSRTDDQSDQSDE